MRRKLGHANDALDGPRSAFRDGAETLFFDGGEAAGKAAGRDGVLADGVAIALGLVVGCFELSPRDLVCSSAREYRAQGDHLHDFFEETGASAIDHPIAEAAHYRIARETGGAVGEIEPPALAPLCGDI